MRSDAATPSTMRQHAAAFAWLSAALLAAAPASAGSPVPVTDPFTVSPASVDDQTEPRVEAGQAGEFVVGWYRWDGTHRVQRVSSAGRLLGTEITVDEGTYGPPALLARDSGEFTFVYQQFEGPISRLELQRFDADGVAVGPPVLVDSMHEPGLTFNHARLAGDAQGRTFVVWHFEGWSTGPRHSVPFPLYWLGASARGFLADGTSAGPPFYLSPVHPSVGEWPLIVNDGPDVFTALWSDGDAGSLVARAFSTDGTALGPAYPVPSPLPYWDLQVAAQRLTDGTLGLAWSEEGEGAMFQRLDSSGRPLGDPVSVFQATDPLVALAATPSSGFAIAVGAYLQGVWLQWFLPDGTPTGAATRVDLPAASTSTGEVDLAVDSAGNALVTWERRGNEPPVDIQGRVFRSPVVFVDGFESGDTSAWSATVN